MDEEISVYYSQGRHWAYTKSELNKLGNLPSSMNFVFVAKQDKKVSLPELRLRVQAEAHVRGITEIVNL